MSSIVLFWDFFSESTNSESKKRIQAMFTSTFWCCSLTLCILRTKHCVRLAPSWLWAEAVFVPSVSLQGWVMSRVCLSVPLALLGLSCVSTAQLSTAARASSWLFLQWLLPPVQSVVICLHCSGYLSPVLGSSLSPASAAHWMNLGRCWSAYSAASFT